MWNSNEPEKWVDGHHDHAVGQKYNQAQTENVALVVEEKIVCPVTQIDDCVKHTIRGHNQEADFLASREKKTGSPRKKRVSAKNKRLGKKKKREQGKNGWCKKNGWGKNKKTGGARETTGRRSTSNNNRRAREETGRQEKNLVDKKRTR